MREHPKISITTLHEKLCEGTRLIVGSNGKKIENKWAIRREAPQMVNPQRLDGDGSIHNIYVLA